MRGSEQGGGSSGLPKEGVRGGGTAACGKGAVLEEHSIAYVYYGIECVWDVDVVLVVLSTFFFLSFGVME